MTFLPLGLDAMLLGLLTALAIGAAVAAPFVLWARRSVHGHRRAIMETVRDDLRHIDGPLRLH
jgi:hypothetical protein